MIYFKRSIRAQQIGNYEDARQSLQRFFDYSLHYSMISLFPYSSLDMALLHMNFGHREQALRVSIPRFTCAMLGR